MIVAPDRETPGTSARIWHRPTPNARDSGMRSASIDNRPRTQAFDEQHDDAAADKGTGKYARTLVQNGLYVVCEERAGEEHRDRGDDDGGGEMARPRAGPELCGHIDELPAIDPYDREYRSELDHHGEDAAWIVVAQGLAEKQQMRRGGDRKKLRDSLYDSEQRRG